MREKTIPSWPHRFVAITLVLGGVFFGSAFSAQAEGGAVTQSGPLVGTVTVTATPIDFTSPISNGLFDALRASSSVKAAGAPESVDSDDQPVPPATFPYIVGTAYATKQTKVTGVKFEPQSKVSVVAKAKTATDWKWSATAANYGIGVVAPGQNTGETATAQWTVVDPITILTGPGSQISVGYVPDQDWSFIFADSTLNYVGSAQVVGSANTSVPGFESLFQWSISMGTLSPGQVNVLFTSNPLLGLDDTIIESGIQSRYTYDQVTGNYNFDNSGFALGATFDVPDGITSVEVQTSLGSRLDASSGSGVPEAGSSLLLFCLGVLPMLAKLRFDNRKG
jgi:hypothetical protein